MKKVIILGTAHLSTTPGKCSPDKQLREAVYSRDIVLGVEQELKKRGYEVYVDYRDLAPNRLISSTSPKEEQRRELSYRAKTVNAICESYKKKARCIYVSVHVNAAGADGNWHEARGWSVYTSPGNTDADKLATCLYNAAAKLLPNDNKNYVRGDFADNDPDYEAGFYVLMKTQCPAVLTENLFQDNKEDVAFLLSEKGRKAIVSIHVEGIEQYLKENAVAE